MTFDRNTRNWIGDRVSNREPLMWNSFIEFMSDLGGEPDDKVMKKYRSKSYRKAVKGLYNKAKKSKWGLGLY